MYFPVGFAKLNTFNPYFKETKERATMYCHLLKKYKRVKSKYKRLISNANYTDCSIGLQVERHDYHKVSYKKLDKKLEEVS